VNANLTNQITEACATAFFPDPPIPADIRKQIISVSRSTFGGAFVHQASSLIGCTAYIRNIADRGTLRDLSGEKRLRLFSETISALESNFKGWLAGMESDVLDEFPAQRLICTRTATYELVDWNQKWTKCGGRFYDGKIVAPKWNPLWRKISAFGLPSPPFELGSGYEVEDVDREEGEALGLHLPPITNVIVKINLDTVEMCHQFLLSLDRLTLLDEC
jgi:hypothetical protein